MKDQLKIGFTLFAGVFLSAVPFLPADPTPQLMQIARKKANAGGGGGQSFSDDFDDRGSDEELGDSANWTEYNTATNSEIWADDSETYILPGNTAPGQDPDNFETLSAIYTGQQCDTVSHWALVRLVGENGTASAGLILRAENSSTANCYHVTFDSGSNQMKWEVATAEGSFQETVQTSSGITFTNTHYYGAEVSGTGDSTVIDIWDLGTSDPGTTGPSGWGTADISMTNNPTSACDVGKYVGVRFYTADSAGQEIIDNFRGGDS